MSRLLYHFSENPSIDIFIPQAKQNRTDMPPAVWAIDETHSVNYFFPRDCPRISFRKSSHVSEEDLAAFFSHTIADTIIAVEHDWLERIKNTTIYRYAFHTEDFELLEKTAGYYISNKPVSPVSMEPLDNLIGRIVRFGDELRFTPNLYPLRNAILSSTVDCFSIIRFSNAKRL